MIEITECEKEARMHSPNVVYQAYLDIANGKTDNCSFSHADVVFLSKEAYCLLLDAAELGLKRSKL